MLHIKKELRFSTQKVDDVKKAIELNIKEDYSYILVDDNKSLIGLDGLKMLIKAGYELNPYNENLEFWHKNYKAEKIEME